MERARRLALSQLACLGRHTMTGVICTSGRQFEDWSGDYKLFSKNRFDREKIFAAVRSEALCHLGDDGDVVCAMDDSLMRKKGRKIPGTGNVRDPLSPPFHANLAWGLRFVQTSMIIPPKEKAGPARAVPVDFTNAPLPKKPRKNSPPEKWRLYWRLREQFNLSRLGARRIGKMRAALDSDERTAGRRLLMAVDNKFTNKKVFRNLPERTVLVGRLRHDASLYHLPVTEDQPNGKGRKKSYGQRVPTPEEIRRDDSIPWQRVPVFAAGKTHNFKVKVVSPLLWRPAGADKPLMLVVIAPLSYRPSRKSQILYRRPAYLACTDPDMEVQKVIQAYVWRWEIEVNFRDEKQLVGLGEAQVWNDNSVENDPAFVAAAYAILLLAGLKAFPACLSADETGQDIYLEPPKWRKKDKPRLSTQDLINQLRCELWGKAIGYERVWEGENAEGMKNTEARRTEENNFNGFSKDVAPFKKPKKLNPNLLSAVLYATG